MDTEQEQSYSSLSQTYHYNLQSENTILIHNLQPRQTDKVQLQLAILDSDEEEDKNKILSKLKKEQLRKTKLLNKMNRAPQNKNSKRKNNQQLLSYQSNYIITPYTQIITPCEDQFVFGEIVLEGNFYNNPFDLEKTYQWSYWKRGDLVQKIKDMECIQVEMGRTIVPQQNFDYAIQRYLNMPDQQMHQLGINLQGYYRTIQRHYDIMKKKVSIFNDTKFQQAFQKCTNEYYFKCLEWLKTQVKNDDLYFYTFYELDFDSYDQNFKYFGYSQSLLNLFGLDSTNAIPFILRKGRIEFIDGISRLKRLICRLNTFNANIKCRELFIDHDLYTLDNIKIPTKQYVRIPNFNCFTPENFEYYDYLEGEHLMDYSLFRLFKFEVNPKIVESIQQQRSVQQQDQSINLEYSMMSEIFIDKFYKDNENRKNNESKICGYKYV